jgi:hypothetical protein
MVTSQSRRVASVAVVFALLPLTACGDSLVPPGFAGTYVLESIDGGALPTAHGRSDLGTIMLEADTLTLLADGSGVRIRKALTLGPGDEVLALPTRWETELQLDRDHAGRVRLFDAYGCIEMSPCIHGFAYEVRRTRPILELRTGETTLRYRVIAEDP